MVTDHDRGPAARQTAAELLAALQLPSKGKAYSLALPRFTGMPLFGSHPPFQVSMYRTPNGLRGDNQKPWGPRNEVNLGYMAEVTSGTSHSGAHVDALAHMTIGDDDHWYGGSNATEHLGDRGPTRGDGSKLPPFITRGILLDVPAYRGIVALPSHEAVTAQELEAVMHHQRVEIRPGDVVLIRSGCLVDWPDREAMAKYVTAGPDISAARWLLEKGVVAAGSDTETFEVQPAPDPGHPANPQPVHTLLLIENAIYLFESIYLEEIAREKVYEFLFVALPLKVQGTTGSMVDPVAIV
ncbi:MAG TPA: cyclase family protein [Microbacterium sp.]|uniref:cyclase family protein n=1 Tax=Microbacterium sp. TaxID=51671 RepID=UPI002C52E336|nr:cyclase family protein [Microbacterium sp.]HWI32173.1 cyclase family protein [Microbacterium sp.]